MAPELASVVDAIHALVMVLWVLGLPLLFWHRWPRLMKEVPSPIPLLSRQRCHRRPLLPL